MALLLIMVAPPLLIAGRPVTLLLHVTRNPVHTRVKHILRSRLTALAVALAARLVRAWSRPGTPAAREAYNAYLTSLDSHGGVS